MIHQPLIAGGQGGGLSGQATDIKIHADHIIRTRAKMNRLLSEYTGQPLEKVEQDTERDNFLSAQEPRNTASLMRSSPTAERQKAIHPG